LTQILSNYGTIMRATRRRPGEAAVVVSVVHVVKGEARTSVLLIPLAGLLIDFAPQSFSA
jgi:hypothetical protein